MAFGDFNFDAASGMQGGGGAAGIPTTSDMFNAYRQRSTNWDDFGANVINASGYAQRAAQDADYMREIGEITNDTAFEIGKLQAKAAKKQSKQNKSTNMWGNIIKTGASLGAFALLSDERAKNTVANIDDALSTLRKLRPVTFYYNEEYSSNPERMHRGFIAQEYKEVLPSATYYDEVTDRFCIDTHELIALLVRSVQELELKIGRLEAVNALAGVKS